MAKKEIENLKKHNKFKVYEEDGYEHQQRCKLSLYNHGYRTPINGCSNCKYYIKDKGYRNKYKCEIFDIQTDAVGICDLYEDY